MPLTVRWGTVTGSKWLSDPLRAIFGIFAEDGKNAQGMKKKMPLYLKKHWLALGVHTLEFTVKGQPVKAGIDPYNKLTDRVPDDNVKDLDEA